MEVGSPFIVFNPCAYMSGWGHPRGRVTLGVGSPCYLRRVTLLGGYLSRPPFDLMWQRKCQKAIQERIRMITKPNMIIATPHDIYLLFQCLRSFQ